MYDTAAFVASILAPLVGNTEHHIANSTELVKTLSGFTLDKDELMVSFDVTALFTSVPVQESLDIIKQRLNDDETLRERTSLSVNSICELLACCLNTTYFTFEGRFFQQTEGAAMGSPVSPIVANLFMEHFEQKALSSFHTPPRYWGRYMDDTMTFLHTNVVEEFTSHLNAQHPAIKFTRETEENSTIAMLDMRVFREEGGKLTFGVYRKKTHTDQYLQFDSHQPLQHKLGVIRTLRHRADTICSTQATKEEELNHLKTVLTASGYRKWAWDLPAKNKTSGPATNRSTPARGHVTMPYVQGVTEAMARKARDLGVSVHPQPINTIRGKLVRPKDPPEKLSRSNVVYKISCQNCPDTYVGETERNLNKRFKEHGKEASPVGAHMNRHNHHFDEDSIEILDTENEWFRRGVKESIHIAAAEPKLNQDRGRHNLPSVYSSLIKANQFH
jgi:hypothetical protein